MKNQRKKQAACGVMALLIAALLCGCGHSDSSEKSDGTKQETQIDKSKRMDEQQK